MNWLEHEYLVPVIIGSGRDAVSAARTIYRNTSIKPHIFAERFSIMQKMLCYCHKISPMRVELLTESLMSFAESLEEHCLPLIICGERTKSILKTYSDIIEAHYIVTTFDDITAKGECIYDED